MYTQRAYVLCVNVSDDDFQSGNCVRWELMWKISAEENEEEMKRKLGWTFSPTVQKQ